MFTEWKIIIIIAGIVFPVLLIAAVRHEKKKKRMGKTAAVGLALSVFLSGCTAGSTSADTADPAVTASSASEEKTTVFDLIGLSYEDYQKTYGKNEPEVLSADVSTVYTVPVDDSTRIFYETEEDEIAADAEAVMAETPLSAFLGTEDDGSLDSVAHTLAETYENVSYCIYEFPKKDESAVYAGDLYAEYTFTKGEETYYMDLPLTESGAFSSDTEVRIYQQFFTSVDKEEAYLWLTRTADETAPFPTDIFFMKYMRINDYFRIVGDEDDLETQMAGYSFPNSDPLITPDQIVIYDDYIEITGITIYKPDTYATEAEAQNVLTAEDSYGVTSQLPDGTYTNIGYNGYALYASVCYEGSLYLSRDCAFVSDRGTSTIAVDEPVADYASQINCQIGLFRLDENGYISEIRERTWG